MLFELERQRAVDGAEQVANIAAQSSVPSPAWQPFNVVKAQLCDNKNGEK